MLNKVLNDNNKLLNPPSLPKVFRVQLDLQPLSKTKTKVQEHPLALLNRIRTNRVRLSKLRASRIRINRIRTNRERSTIRDNLPQHWSLETHQLKHRLDNLKPPMLLELQSTANKLEDLKIRPMPIKTIRLKPTTLKTIKPRITIPKTLRLKITPPKTIRLRPTPFKIIKLKPIWLLELLRQLQANQTPLTKPIRIPVIRSEELSQILLHKMELNHRT